MADDLESRVLSEAQAVRAVHIMQWFASQTLRTTNATRLQQQERRAQELRTVLVQKGGRATLRDLDRAHGFNKKEVCAYAKAHPEMFECYKIKGEAGRPSHSVRLLKM